MVNQVELRQIARAFLHVLNREGINSNRDVVGKLGSNYRVGGGLEDFVSICERPSNSGTTAYVLDYIQKDRGIPIEIRINNQLNYGEFIIKCSSMHEGYDRFGEDDSENIFQSKVIKPDDNKPLDFYLARNELIELSKLQMSPAPKKN
jgi:hypothetical protein